MADKETPGSLKAEPRGQSAQAGEPDAVPLAWTPAFSTPAFWAPVAWGVLGIVYHLYLVFSGLLPNLVTRPLHMAFALPWIFMIGASAGTGWYRRIGYAIGITGMACCVWIAANRDRLGDQYGALETPFQMVVAILLILVTLEMARRSVKWVMPAVALLFLVYGVLGSAIPGYLGHPGLPLESFLGTLTIAEGGLWGQLTGISVNVVAIFVILGALVSAGEAGEGFMRISVKIAGRFRAGAARVAVIASAFFGSISGSASANVASTGAITLPMMRRLGYPPAFAAAVEAVASTGGQIMPPLMGAGAFVMVELLRLPYTAIVLAATIPALLFFWTAWAGVGHAARDAALKPLPPDALPSWGAVAAALPFFGLPFSVLLILLFATDKTPQYAAALGALVAGALLVVDIRGSVSLRRWGVRLARAAVAAGEQIAVIAAIILCAGLIVGVLHMTGLGVKITSIILSLAGGNLWVALLLTAIACLILGMEVPTTAAYVICVSVAGPALQELGLPPLAAHLFVFWYALLSTITPPVCGTVFIAAGMTGASWTRTAGHAMKLGLGLYLVPLAFVAEPALIDPLARPLITLGAGAKAVLGLWLVGRGLADAPLWQRAAALLAGLVLLFFLSLSG